MQQQIRDIAKQRVEAVWIHGSPMKGIYTTLSCELCIKDIKEAVCMPLGYSWRSGWVFLCKDCYYSANYWKEDEDDLDITYNNYCVKVS